MRESSVQKLARVLRVLVIIVFVCNILALFAVPVMAVLTPRGAIEAGAEGLGYLFGGGEVPEDYWPFTMMFFLSWIGVWADQYTAVLTVFLWVCGICTAIILWQAKRVLETILEGETFTLGNAANMKRAACSSFVVSGAALIRTVWGVCVYKSIVPMLTYNFLFVPLFLMAGLLFLVMSALFRQAAEMKAENDLTI